MDRRFFLAATGIGLINLVTAGCAVEPVTKPVVASLPGHTFYPPPPGSPRIQYLTSYSGEADIVPSVSNFASFIAGDETTTRNLAQPYGVALHDGKLYVVDSGAAGIAVFDIRLGRFSAIAGKGGGRMKKPINITITPEGTKYVCDTGRNQILVFDINDQFIEAIGSTEQFKPVDCVVVGNRLYVVDIEHHQVQILDKNSHTVVGRFGTPGSGPGELFHPTNIAAGPGGDLFVVETSNFRVQRFSADGITKRTYGQIGDGSGTFARPKGIAIDRAGRLFVGDAAFENVQLFDNDGKLLLAFGQSAEPAGRLSLPTGIAIDYDNTELFTRFAAPGFSIEFVIMVVSQFGPNKVDVFGFGKMAGHDYSADQTTVDRLHPDDSVSTHPLVSGVTPALVNNLSRS